MDFKAATEEAGSIKRPHRGKVKKYLSLRAIAFGLCALSPLVHAEEFPAGPGAVYSVKFPSPPVIKEVSAIDGSRSLGALLGIEAEETILRAEYGESAGTSAAVEDILYELRVYASRFGLQGVSIEIVRSEKTGQCGVLHAAKYVSAKPVESWITYRVKLCVNESHLIVATVMTPSEKFPTSAGMKFLDSLTLKNQ